MSLVQETVEAFSDFMNQLGYDPSFLQPRQDENKKLFFDNQEHQEKYEIFISVYKSGFSKGQQRGIDLCVKEIGRLIAKTINQ